MSEDQVYIIYPSNLWVVKLCSDAIMPSPLTVTGRKVSSAARSVSGVLRTSVPPGRSVDSTSYFCGEGGRKGGREGGKERGREGGGRKEMVKPGTGHRSVNGIPAFTSYS